MDRMITFATKSYLRPAILQHTYAKLLGFRHYIYTEKDLPQSINDYAIKYPRGYGYWSWKCWIILHILENMDEGERVWYLDAASIPLTDLKQVKIEDIYIQKNIFYDPTRWCKPSFENTAALGGDYLNKGLVPDASCIGIIKTYKSREVLNHWCKCCMNHNMICDDQLISRKECWENSFIDHRHDQAMLGYSAMCLQICLSPALTQFGEGPLSIYHHRSTLKSAKSIFIFIVSFIKYFSRVKLGLGQEKKVWLLKKYL